MNTRVKENIIFFSVSRNDINCFFILLIGFMRLNRRKPLSGIRTDRFGA